MSEKMTRAEKELCWLDSREAGHPGKMKQWFMDWHQRHSLRVPSREEIENLMEKYIQNITPKEGMFQWAVIQAPCGAFLVDLMDLMHPKKREWCLHIGWCREEHQGDHWLYTDDGFGYVHPKSQYCQFCGTPRPKEDE